MLICFDFKFCFSAHDGNGDVAGAEAVEVYSFLPAFRWRAVRHAKKGMECYMLGLHEAFLTLTMRLRAARAAALERHDDAQRKEGLDGLVPWLEQAFGPVGVSSPPQGLAAELPAHGNFLCIYLFIF
jgi:hypothetical protein